MYISNDAEDGEHLVEKPMLTIHIIVLR